MRDPELAARAGQAATRLEQAWERWRALHGLAGSSDLLASYVGYSLKEPMGRPRVVIGVDATEAEYFADLLESHDCAAVAQEEPRPANSSAHPRVNGKARTPRDMASEPMVRGDPADQGHLGPAGAERPALTAPASSPGSVTRALPQAPVDVGVGRPPSPPDPLAAERGAGQPVSCRDRRRNSWPTGPRPNRRQPGPRAAPGTGPVPYVSRADGDAGDAGAQRERYLAKVPAKPERLPFSAGQLSLAVSQLWLSLVSGNAAKLTSRGMTPLLPKTSGPGTARPRAGPRHRDAERFQGRWLRRRGYRGGVRSVVQYMHLRAPIGILLRHSGHSRSVAACLRLIMSMSRPRATPPGSRRPPR